MLPTKSLRKKSREPRLKTNVVYSSINNDNKGVTTTVTKNIRLSFPQCEVESDNIMRLNTGKEDAKPAITLIKKIYNGTKKLPLRKVETKTSDEIRQPNSRTRNLNSDENKEKVSTLTNNKYLTTKIVAKQQAQQCTLPKMDEILNDSETIGVKIATKQKVTTRVETACQTMISFLPGHDVCESPINMSQIFGSLSLGDAVSDGRLDFSTESEKSENDSIGISRHLSYDSRSPHAVDHESYGESVCVRETENSDLAANKRKESGNSSTIGIHVNASKCVTTELTFHEEENENEEDRNEGSEPGVRDNDEGRHIANEPDIENKEQDVEDENNESIAAQHKSIYEQEDSTVCSTVEETVEAELKKENELNESYEVLEQQTCDKNAERNNDTLSQVQMLNNFSVEVFLTPLLSAGEMVEEDFVEVYSQELTPSLRLEILKREGTEESSVEVKCVEGYDHEPLNERERSTSMDDEIFSSLLDYIKNAKNKTKNEDSKTPEARDDMSQDSLNTCSTDSVTILTDYSKSRGEDISDCDLSVEEPNISTIAEMKDTAQFILNENSRILKKNVLCEPLDSSISLSTSFTDGEDSIDDSKNLDRVKSFASATTCKRGGAGGVTPSSSFGDSNTLKFTFSGMSIHSKVIDRRGDSSSCSGLSTENSSSVSSGLSSKKKSQSYRGKNSPESLDKYSRMSSCDDDDVERSCEKQKSYTSKIDGNHALGVILEDDPGLVEVLTERRAASRSFDSATRESSMQSNVRCRDDVSFCKSCFRSDENFRSSDVLQSRSSTSLSLKSSSGSLNDDELSSTGTGLSCCSSEKNECVSAKVLDNNADRLLDSFVDSTASKIISRSYNGFHIRNALSAPE